MRKILAKSFFERDTVVVAKELIGKFMVRKVGGREVFAKIVETEAYDGMEDKAAHSSRGRTPRNEVMFGEAGRFYVYFVYGMHWMLNVTCGKKDFPAAVLIRGVEADDLRLNGPAKLTKFLKIDQSFNGKRATFESGLWFEDRGVKVGRERIVSSKRIGVEYAGEWAEKLFRFYLKE